MALIKNRFFVPFMHFRLFLTVILLAVALPPARAQENAPLTLAEAYRMALKQSETLAIRQELIKEAQSRFVQSLSGILPRASFEASHTWEDGRRGTTIDTPERRFTVSQPLFSGFQEFAAMAATRAEGRQRKEEEKRARQLLFRDVSDAFYLYLTFQEDIDVLKSIHKALTDRMAELEKRGQLGRSRASEIASAEARLREVEAELEGAYSRSDVGRQLLEFLTGVEVPAVEDNVDVKVEWKSEEEYIGMIKNRPDVLAAQEAEAAARHEVTVARAGYLPTVDVDGNYYTKRGGTGSAADRDWDVMLRVSIPIFSGGQTAGEVMQQKSQARQAELTRQLAERTAVNDVKNRYAQLKYGIRREEAQGKALAASKKNYELQEEDYRRSLVNNLDVLQALEDFEESQRRYITIKNDLKRAYWEFQVSLGTIDL
jgi:outer membrane protein TolC